MNIDKLTEEEKRFVKKQCFLLAQRAEKLHADFGALIEMIEDEEVKERLREEWLKA